MKPINFITLYLIRLDYHSMWSPFILDGLFDARVWPGDHIEKSTCMNQGT